MQKLITHLRTWSYDDLRSLARDIGLNLHPCATQERVIIGIIEKLCR